MPTHLCVASMQIYINNYYRHSLLPHDVTDAQPSSGKAQPGKCLLKRGRKVLCPCIILIDLLLLNYCRLNFHICIFKILVQVSSQKLGNCLGMDINNLISGGWACLAKAEGSIGNIS